MQYVNAYYTKDFYQSCALRTSGFSILQIDFNPQGIATFVFADPDKTAAKVVAQFWDRKLSADLRTFVESINELKSRIANKS